MTIYRLDDHAPELGAQVWVAPNATVVGRVRLGARASVWWQAVLRGDTEDISVGEGSNVQDGAVLHADPGFPCVIEPRVTVGHRAVVHGAHIGESSLVGIGATVLNGARIGRECLIGARALVTENAEIPDGALVMGAPARVKRMLTDVERARLALSAEHYVQNAARYRDGLEPIVDPA